MNKKALRSVFNGLWNSTMCFIILLKDPTCFVAFIIYKKKKKINNINNTYYT